MESKARIFTKNAKNRLLQKTLAEYAGAGTTGYYLNNRRLVRDEVDRLKNQIKEIAASEEIVIDPLNKLICDEGFYSLDENGKLRYMLELSSIYRELSQVICG